MVVVRNTRGEILCSKRLVQIPSAKDRVRSVPRRCLAPRLAVVGMQAGLGGMEKKRADRIV
jgi:hypothetical protein